MNYCFLGTPNIAAKVLGELIKANLSPKLVITNPNKPTGRKQLLTPPPVKLLAEKHNIPILQPEKLNPAAFENLKTQFDFAILIAYGKIVPLSVINLFPKGMMVIHPSLLPKYRGPTPIQTAILNGELATGTTLFLMDEKVDHGPIIAKAELNEPIDRATSPELFEKLASLSAKLTIETLPRYLKDEITPKPQDESKATYTKKFTQDDAYISLDSDELRLIERKIRALNPEPGAWTILKTPIPKVSLPINKRIKLLEAHIVEDAARDKGNTLVITKVQTEGKTPQIVSIKITAHD